MGHRIAGAALMTLLALPATAQAVPLQYTVNGIDTLAGGEVEFASFQIDSNPVPAGSLAGIGFYVAAIPGTFTYGSTTTTVPQDITFYLDLAHGYDDPTTQPGAFYVGDADLLGFNGPQLFSGPIDNPTLLTGTFTIFDDFSGSPISLTVEPVPGVPEPTSWAMMLLGFGAIGWQLRRNKISAATN